MKRMKKCVPLCMSLLLVAGCSATNEAPNISQPDIVGSDSPQESPLYSAMQTFSKNSAQKLLFDTDNNICYSPASIYIAASLLEMGANKDTSKQILEALSFDQDAQSLAKEIHAFMENTKQSETLEIANSLWYDNDIVMDDEWQKQATDSFFAETFKRSFANDNVGEEMSNWIKEHTKGTLAPSLDMKDSVASIVNTIYFNDCWAKEFKKEANEMAPFTTKANDEQDVEFMHAIFSDYVYFEHDTYEATALPMSSGSSMYLYLPKEGYSTNDVLNNEWLDDINNQSSEIAKVDLRLPKFSYDTQLKGEEMLQSLGMIDAFQSGKADFKATMRDGTSLHVSEVIHGTHVNVNEVGVEASAYTVIPIEKSSLPMDVKRVSLTYNKPFVFVIASPQRIPLFIGVVNTI